jgi:formylglycine-generating enzyme required for sulfatase activity
MALLDSRLVAVASDSVAIIDVSSPGTPTLMTKAALSNRSLFAVGAGEDRVFISELKEERQTGFGVYRIAEDGLLVETGFIESWLPYHFLSHSGRVITTADEGVRVYRLSDEGMPTLEDEFPFRVEDQLSGVGGRVAARFELDGTSHFLVNGRVYSLTESGVREVGSFGRGPLQGEGFPFRAVVSGGKAFVPGSFWVAVYGIPGATAEAVFSVSPEALDYGTVEVGEEKGLELTLANTGEGSVDVTSIRVTGSDADVFLVPKTSFTIGPEQVSGVNLGVIFAPTSSGTKTASVIITHDAPGSPAAISLSGTGVDESAGPAFAPSPDFNGDGKVGFPDFVLFARNFGSREGDGIYDSVYDLDEDGAVGFPDFVLFAKDFGQEVEARQPPVAVVFSVSPETLDYGTVEVGEEKGLKLALTNLGEGSVDVTSIRVTGSDADVFLVPKTSFTIGPEQVSGVNLGVIFAPTSSGTKTASVIITHDAPGSPAVVPLSGTAVRGEPPPGQALVRARIVLPEGRDLWTEGLTVVSPVSSVGFRPAAEIEVATTVSQKPQIVVVENKEGAPVLLGFVSPPNAEKRAYRSRGKATADQALEIGARSTALALVMMNPLLFRSSASDRQEIADLASSHSGFGELIEQIEIRLRNIENPALDDPEAAFLYERAGAILVDILKQPKAGKNVVPDGGDGLWIEDAPGTSVIFHSPYQIYYALEIGGLGLATFHHVGSIPPREPIFELFRWPPFLPTDEGRTEPLALADGAYSVRMSRGFDPTVSMDDPSDPGVRATVLNAGLVIWNVFDILVGVPDVLADLEDLKLTVTPSDLVAVASAIGERDVTGATGALLDIAIDNSESIARWLWGSATAPEGMADYAGSILPLLENATVALRVLDAANAVSLMSDLVSAPSEVTCSIKHEDGVLDLHVPRYALSGRVIGTGGGLANVMVRLGGAEVDSTTSDENGDYLFPSLPDGSYTLTASRIGYSFLPVTRVVLVSGSDLSEEDFVGTEIPTGGPTGGAGDTLVVELSRDVRMAFVYVRPGTFLMGSPDSESGRDLDEGPLHEVTISQGFYLSRYEVTQAQWRAVMSTTPWSDSDRYRTYGQEGPDYPAVNVSWDDAGTFLRKLNDAAGSDVYRLPTEGEWEYACRAGTTTPWSSGDKDELRWQAWFVDNAGTRYTAKVGTKKANPWGLHDMHGNVWEWVQDWYARDYSGVSASTDPLGPASGSDRVRRGGDMGSNANALRSANRDAARPTHHYGDMGFRVLRGAD